MNLRTVRNSTPLLALIACVGLAMPMLAQDSKPAQPVTPKPIPVQTKPTTPDVKGLQPGGPVTTAPGQPVPAKPAVDPHGGVQPSDPAQSPLTWDNGMAFDFGNIPDTQPVTRVFKFTNRTDKRVTVQAAQGSCGCTVPDMPKKVYEPSESGEMTVTFNPQHRRGPQPKAVTVMYAEPSGTPNTTLTINSNVQPLLIIDPIKMYLMEVPTKEGKSTEITVSGRKSDFKVEGIDSNNPNLIVTIGEKRESMIDGEPFQQFPVSVMVKPGTPIGEVQGELMIRTNEPTAPTQSYIFVADVVGELKATPNKLQLRAYTPQVAFANVVTLETRSGKAFKITSVDVEGREDMQLVADVEPTNMTGKPAYTIRLNGVTPDVTGLVAGEIIVRTDIPDNPEIRLPFNTTVRGSAARPINVPTPISH